MVLNHFGETNYDELEISEMMNTHKDLNGNNNEEVGVANEPVSYTHLIIFFLFIIISFSSTLINIEVPKNYLMNFLSV